jgi:hypothetical protein
LDQTNINKLKTFVEEHPYIIHCVRTFGSWDLLFTICTENSQHFHTTVKDIKRVFSHLVVNHQTWIAYQEHLYKSLPNVVSEQDIS